MFPIAVVNNFGQFNHLIFRMLRDLGIDAKMIPNTAPPGDVASQYRGVILGGGPTIERAGHSPLYLESGIPVLGICLGLHVIARRYGGEVIPGQFGGYGAVSVEILDHDEILQGYPREIQVWASHADEVSRAPEGFLVLARSPVCGIEAIADPVRRVYGIQWHPEVSHTVQGSLVYQNFDRLTRER